MLLRPKHLLLGHCWWALKMRFRGLHRLLRRWHPQWCNSMGNTWGLNREWLSMLHGARPQRSLDWSWKPLADRQVRLADNTALARSSNEVSLHCSSQDSLARHDWCTTDRDGPDAMVLWLLTVGSDPYLGCLGGLDAHLLLLEWCELLWWDHLLLQVELTKGCLLGKCPNSLWEGYGWINW